MAFTTGVAADQDALMTALSVFVAANGWTVDELDTTANQMSLSRGSVFVHFAWDDNSIAMYQSLAFDGPSIPPHTHTDDSGNGDTTPATVNSERRVNDIGAGPYTAHHFFEDDATAPYVHVVLEYAPGLYRHFGFGTIDKSGDWTGGEYVYGHLWDQSASGIDAPNSLSHSLGLDVRSSTDNVGATMHVEGLTAQDAAGKWGVFTSDSPIANDPAGNPRVRLDGFVRTGFWITSLVWIPASPNDAFVPLVPVQVWYRETTPSPDRLRFLGEQIDKKVMNMKFFTPGQVVTVGADDWRIFPWVRKRFLEDNQEESRNAGLAYRQVP